MGRLCCLSFQTLHLCFNPRWKEKALSEFIQSAITSIQPVIWKKFMTMWFSCCVLHFRATVPTCSVQTRSDTRCTLRLSLTSPIRVAVCEKSTGSDIKPSLSHQLSRVCDARSNTRANRAGQRTENSYGASRLLYHVTGKIQTSEKTKTLKISLRKENYGGRRERKWPQRDFRDFSCPDHSGPFFVFSKVTNRWKWFN